MTLSTNDSRLAAPVAQHAAFFRQSGWLMIAGIIGGMMSWAVHFLSKRIADDQYGIFVTLLMVIACVPIMPLQMVLAQQTAGALAANRERQLAGLIRTAWFWTFILWLAGALVTLAFQDRIVERWNLTNPAALWVTLLAVLVSLWSPMFNGVLQGRQDFFWLGWAQIALGLVRVAVAALIVLVFSGGAAGMMLGAMLGIGVAAAIAIWRTRALWSLPREPYRGEPLLAQIVPLMLGFGACQFMFTSDTMFAKSFFSGEQMACYGAAGTLSRALLWLVMPLATVMFPKLVHSHIRSEKTNLFAVVLAGTAILTIGGAIGLWLLGPWMVGFVGKAHWVEPSRTLLPWYGAAMVPLALANVLANDLLARGRYRVVPFMVVLAVLYGLAMPWVLNRYPSLVHALQTLFVANLLLLITCGIAALKSAKPA